jgi:phosphatidate cytidylyltransferase
MKIDKNNRTIINIFGAPLIIVSIMYSEESFMLLLFIVITFSFYEFICLLQSKSKITFKNLILGFFWISSIGYFLPVYQNFNPNFILVIFVAVWITDSFAYIFGKQFGVKKIFPAVSPNKTWVGSISGLIASILFLYTLHMLPTILSFFGRLTPIKNILPSYFNFYDILILGIITGVVGQYGDYIESLFKRRLNVKDSSNILLGHGGFLDRFDSLFIVGFFTFIYLLIRDLII